MQEDDSDIKQVPLLKEYVRKMIVSPVDDNFRFKLTSSTQFNVWVFLICNTRDGRSGYGGWPRGKQCKEE